MRPAVWNLVGSACLAALSLRRMALDEGDMCVGEVIVITAQICWIVRGRLD